MRIAVPVANGCLSMHFGHCQAFALIDVDEEKKTILKKQEVEAPEHVPGLLPRWLHERGAGVILAGGMGRRAQQFFNEYGIRVVIGAPAEAPETIVKEYLAGTLQTGQNICDH
jgi:predicted Fe-Mo cluster-binding NifX family protein